MTILQTVGLLGRVFSSFQGLYLNTGQHKHRVDTYIYQTFMLFVGFEPMTPASERGKTVHALDRIDRLVTSIYTHGGLIFINAFISKYWRFENHFIWHSVWNCGLTHHNIVFKNEYVDILDIFPVNTCANYICIHLRHGSLWLVGNMQCNDLEKWTCAKYCITATADMGEVMDIFKLNTYPPTTHPPSTYISTYLSIILLFSLGA
jgi:hypothetical protein